jgi:hypothetical protein
VSLVIGFVRGPYTLRQYWAGLFEGAAAAAGAAKGEQGEEGHQQGKTATHGRAPFG